MGVSVVFWATDSSSFFFQNEGFRRCSLRHGCCRFWHPACQLCWLCPIHLQLWCCCPLRHAAGAYHAGAYAAAPAVTVAAAAAPAPVAVAHAPIAYATVNPYDYAGQIYPVAEPYIHEEIPAEEYVHEDIAAEPYVHEEIAAEPYVHEEIPAEAYVHEEIPAEAYVHEEIPAEAYIH